jgi:hypothetical protein
MRKALPAFPHRSARFRKIPQMEPFLPLPHPFFVRVAAENDSLKTVQGIML